MISSRNYIKCIFLILFVTTAKVSYSQINDKETLEQIIRDIHNRNFDSPILLISNELSSMEQLPTSEFQDTIYIGLTNLLATAYVQNNQIAEADRLLTNAIGFFDGVTRKTALAYQLYFAYGTVAVSMENYETARIYLEVTIDFLKNSSCFNEDYGVILGVLAVCHMKTGQVDLAYEEIMESISVIEQSSSRFTPSNLIQVYEKAAAICKEMCKSEESKEYIKKAYNLCVGIDDNTSEFINVGIDLATIYLNEENYPEALNIFHQIEKLKLSDMEKAKVYNGIYFANYYLDNEWDCVNYADKCNKTIKDVTINLFSTLPLGNHEDKWYSNSMQLKVNLGLLDKFPNNQLALRTSYDNLLFTKRVLFEYYDYLRSASKKEPFLQKTLGQIKHLRAAIFASNINEDYSTLKKELIRYESDLLYGLQEYSDGFNVDELPTWKNVKDNLQTGEYAIEFTTYVGFCQKGEEKKLRYAALIVTSQSESPQFVDLCSHEELHNLFLDVIANQEIGQNNLYKKEENNTRLYDLLWNNIEPMVKYAKTIYCTPILTIQNINIGYIVCPDGKYLNEKYNIRILTSSGLLCKREERNEIKSAVVFGGINYSTEGYENKPENKLTYRDLIVNNMNDTTRYGFGSLFASEVEADNIANCLVGNGIKVSLLKNTDATESSFCDLDGGAPSIIHIASHAFYLVGFNNHMDYFKKLKPYSYKDLSLILTGLLLSGANNTLLNATTNTKLYDGVLTAEEISLLDLSDTELVVLSACNTSSGVTLQEGYGGLVKAFKMAGVKQLLVSLWPVADDATAVLMTNFYNYLVKGVGINQALLKAQQDLSKLYQDPYYWAGFILLDALD